MRALVRRHIEHGFNRGDWTVCETTLADDYTRVTEAQIRRPGRSTQFRVVLEGRRS